MILTCHNTCTIIVGIILRISERGRCEREFKNLECIPKSIEEETLMSYPRSTTSIGFVTSAFNHIEIT